MKHKLTIIVFSILMGFLFLVNMLVTVAGAYFTNNSMLMSVPEIRRQAVVSSIYNSVNNPEILKYPFVELNSMFQLAIGKNIVEDPEPTYTVVRMDNDYLTFVYPEYDTDFYAQDLIDFNNELSQMEIPMLYVQVPIKNDKYNKDMLPYGIEDYSNDNADKLVNKIKSNGVDTVDLREVLHSEDADLTSKFFRTDHHWLPETAFDAHSYICEKLNKDYSFDIDRQSYDINNFSVDVIKDYVLGHIGNRAGYYYSGGTEDISIIKPDFPTYYHFSRIIDATGNYSPEFKSGSYENTILHMRNLEQKIVYSRIGYHTYIGGDYGELRIENENAQSDKHILLVRDSFAAPFASFMSTAVKNLDVVDLRFFGEDRTLSDYVEQTDPDMVIFFMSPHMYEDAYTQALDFYEN